jgi:putative copper export protein
MYSIAYILHIVGIALWIGSFAALGFLLRSLVRKGESLERHSLIVEKIRRFVNFGILPGLVIVLVTGVIMILQFDREHIPFYLTFMEQAGTLIILLTIIFVSMYSRKMGKKLQGVVLKKDKPLESLALMYTNFMFLSAALSVMVIVVVGLRIV